MREALMSTAAHFMLVRRADRELVFVRVIPVDLTPILLSRVANMGWKGFDGWPSSQAHA